MLGGALPRGLRPRILLQMLRYSTPPAGHYSKAPHFLSHTGYSPSLLADVLEAPPRRPQQRDYPQACPRHHPEGPWDSCKQETAALPPHRQRHVVRTLGSESPGLLTSLAVFPVSQAREREMEMVWRGRGWGRRRMTAEESQTVKDPEHFCT